jgi:hypothetical protein
MGRHFDMQKVGEMPERNTVFDFDGKIYSRLRRESIESFTDEISPFFVDALLNGGQSSINTVDRLARIVRAPWDVLSGSAGEGASIDPATGLQQLTLGGRTINRKT